MQELLNSLNSDQLEAVLYNDGPLLLLAGAGTGKTRVLTSKIAYLLENNFAQAQNLLAVTFTNRAADEVKKRVASMVSGNTSGMWIGTFHSVSARILREHGDRLGLNRDFAIVDNSEQISLIRRIMQDFDVDSRDCSPKYYSEMIGRIKNGRPGTDNSLYRLAEICEVYNSKLKQNNGCDFNDLLLNVLKLLTDCDDIRKHYNETLNYLLVDEYQDTNAVQRQWLKLISGVEKNEYVKLTCVGDDDQSIYGWRGADINNMLQFVDDYSRAKVLKLERNYRSTQNILNAASALIAHNRYRHSKTLYAGKDGSNDRVRVNRCNDMKQEAIVMVKEIKKLKDSGSIDSYGEVGILIRASYQTRIMEDVFLRFQLPYKIVGGTKFFERREIKECLAYLRLVNNLNDSLAFERVINSPKRGVGPATISKLRDYAIYNGVNRLVALSNLCSNGTIAGKTRDKVLDFANSIIRWHNEIGSIVPKILMQNILRRTRLRESFDLDSDIESRTKLENIDELVDTLGDFSTVDSFLEYTSLMSRSEEDDFSLEAVNVMTMHAAKGLEFRAVFLPNWQEGIFPSPRSLEEPGGLEEERRLAYVALTRARKRLYISHSLFKYENREIIAMEKSRFIDELPNDSLDLVSCELDSQYYSDYYARNDYTNKNYTNGGTNPTRAERFSEYEYDSPLYLPE
ncbi:MAG: UvrD-helicase domain-containing protein [Rickettsiales bacterium]|jgi:DNA helicase-2/ATP-dependent DNA helicase PcrA|nr:UvrD-helicase domain-containing protein [Rickettsiales bacterium]